jgi:hypothetical protein
MIFFTDLLDGNHQINTYGYYQYDGHMIDLTRENGKELTDVTTEMGSEFIDEMCGFEVTDELEENPYAESPGNTNRGVDGNCL